MIMNIPNYSMIEFETDLAKMQPRAFDIYLLGPFMVYFAMKAKRPMGRWTRRMLFGAGVYMTYRNWQRYKDIPNAIARLRAGVSIL